MEIMMGVSAVLLGVALGGYLWPEGFDRLVVVIAEWVATFVEIP